MAKPIKLFPISLVLALSAINEILSSDVSPRIGLAPHERPSCQSVNQTPKLENQVGIDAVSPQSQLKGKVESSKIATKSKFDSSDRLRKLRQLMKASNYDAYLVTLEDEHGSEFPSEQDNRLQFISGFTGSRGYALILMDRAVFITDGRYKIQAEQELDCNWWTISDSGNIADLIQWLKENTAKGLKVAINARLISLQEYELLESTIQAMESQTLLLSQDLVDTVWNGMPNDARKPVSNAPILIHPIQYAGISWQQKLVRLSDKMNELQLGSYVITALDEIAWLFNLRGADLPYNPLFKAYVLISKYQAPQAIQQQVMPINPFAPIASAAPQVAVRTVDIMQVISVTLYIDLRRITPTLRDYLGVDNATITLRTITDETSGSQRKSGSKIVINLVDYDLFVKDLSERFSLPGKISGRLAIPIRSNVAVHTMAKNYQDRVILTESLIVFMKGVKSDVEVHNMREAHIRDSLAISMLLAQLDSDISADVAASMKPDTNANLFPVSDQNSSQTKWNEISAANQLELYRKLMQNNRGLSFETISAFGSNGAIIHYGPSESTSKTIDNSSMYLLDSGGQYLDGTTDITRTTHFGQPNDWQRETYTRVLMGSIDTMMLRFPALTTYKVSDILARRHLYEVGLDYAHGTGHGIGAYGLVHESPSIIGKHGASSGPPSKSTTQSGVPIISSHIAPIVANMMSSVEPGYYKQDDFGIRIEDIVVVKNIMPAQQFNNNQTKNTSVVNLTTTTSTTTGDQQQQNKQRGHNKNSGIKFLGFEPMSLVPYEPKLIKFHILSEQQKSWLNQYNRLIRNKLIALIKQFMNVLEGRKKKRLAVNQEIRPADHNNHNSTYNRVSNLYNGLIDDETLRLALQRAHLWILIKTEFIPMATKSDHSGHHVTRYFDQLNDDDTTNGNSNNGLMLSYSVGAQQSFDNIHNQQQDDISNYRCDETINPKSCGLFMMAANQFHRSANARNDAAQRLPTTHEPIIYFISLIVMQIIVTTCGGFHFQSLSV